MRTRGLLYPKSFIIIIIIKIELRVKRSKGLIFLPEIKFPNV